MLSLIRRRFLSFFSPDILVCSDISKWRRNLSLANYLTRNKKYRCEELIFCQKIFILILLNHFEKKKRMVEIGLCTWILLFLAHRRRLSKDRSYSSCTNIWDPKWGEYERSFDNLCLRTRKSRIHVQRPISTILFSS